MLSAVFTRSLTRVAVRELAFMLPNIIRGVRSLFAKRRLPVYLLSADGKVPTRAYPGDAGLDLYTSKDIVVEPGQVTSAPTSIAVELPKGTFGYVTGRSSWGKRGLWVFQGTVDAGYRGEIHVLLYNLNKEPLHIPAGTKIAQMLIIPFVNITPDLQYGLPRSNRGRNERGARGFGSSGF